MTEPLPQYTPTLPASISVVAETDWQTRLLDLVVGLRGQNKSAIIWYDARLNLLRVVPFDNMRTVKLD